MTGAGAPADAAPSAATGVTVTVTGLRNANGQVLACLTTRADSFPDCDKDPQARKLKVPAHHGTVELDFGRVPAGRYAVSLIHDENGNGKLDTRLFIPREGFAFSNNAPVVMGPPKFEHAAFDVQGEAVHLEIRMKYLL
ncbi:DUF2141 domain-containing protein [Novosphingobium sp. Leaf2]|uniref:DUF2141 domain-containing protein n=1 Tax=Novosphingobium sp. Leaf2 TaxID=1735670 RepID=UPI0006F55616|nr:DUF2141 domain-containing protein [Novosphingobium sp. Leaf2]KQM21775.1 hypothetical protein ASE49_00135 [Novosphingobium sp. Leaf2]